MKDDYDNDYVNDRPLDSDFVDPSPIPDLDGGLKIIGLKIDGIRKLSAIEMQFKDKGLIQIKGRNEQGKTSVLDSLAILLKGTKHLEKDMIQHGKEKAEIVATLGDYTIKRVITKKSNRLEILTKNGLEMSKKPQAFLDTLINELTFDPRPFLTKTPEQKLKFMMDLFKLDFSKENYAIEGLEIERRLVGREIKAMGGIPKVEKVEPVEIESLFAEKNEAVNENEGIRQVYEAEKQTAMENIYDHNNLQRERKRAIETEHDGLQRLSESENEIMQQLINLKNELEIVRTDIQKKKANIKALPMVEPEKPLETNMPSPFYNDLDSYDARITAAHETNREAEAYQQYLKECRKKADKREEHSTLTEHIDELREAKKDRLLKVNIPIPGLEIREDGIYHNDIFSENWSETEGLKISSELCIAMKPTLQAIFIDHGEGYDSGSLKALGQWAIDNNIQCFITIVSDDIPGAKTNGVFYIEAGEIV